MEGIVSQLESKSSWKEAMRKCCRKNKLNVDLVAYFTPLRFKSAHTNFLLNHQRKPLGQAERWLQNELKGFYWICVALSCVKDKSISAFDDQDWYTLQQVFPFKRIVTLKYQTLRMTVQAGRQPEWTQEEDIQLCQILRSEQECLNKWNQFARQLFQSSQGKFLRSGKQCRERWLNHLDPEKKHGNWSLEEDRMLAQVLLKVGKRWSKVAKLLGKSRTQHMVKNRYKTIVGRQKRRHPSVCDEDMLLRLFVNGDTCSKDEITGVQSKLREDSFESKQEKREKDNEQEKIQVYSEEKQKRVILQEVREQDFKDLIVNEDQDQKESILKIATPRLCDLPQIYSPWFVPITPTLSPNVSFFINVPNFSSYQNHFANSFYNPTRLEPQSRSEA